MWNAAVQDCKGSLEPNDLDQVEACTNPQELRSALQPLQYDIDERKSSLVLGILHHPIVDLERVCASISGDKCTSLDCAIVWGMILLLVKVSRA